MFGFKAFAEAPIAAEKEQAHVDASVDASQTVSFPAITIASCLSEAQVGASVNASFPATSIAPCVAGVQAGSSVELAFTATSIAPCVAGVQAGSSVVLAFTAPTIAPPEATTEIQENAGVSLTFPSVSIDLATTDQSGGANTDGSLVTVTVDQMSANATSACSVQLAATAVAITAAEATVRGDSSIAFVTLIEATTDIAAGVTVTASPSVDFPSVSIDTPAASINAGSTLETAFPATGINVPLAEVSTNASISVTASASISAGVIAVSVDDSITVAFTGPVIAPAVVAFSGGASVDVDASVIGGTIDVQVFGVEVTEFPTVPVPVVKVVVPTVSVTHTANVEVTHNVSITAPAASYANDITAFASDAVAVDITATTGRASLLTIIETDTTSSSQTFAVTNNNRPSLPSSYYNFQNGFYIGTSTYQNIGSSANNQRFYLVTNGSTHYHVRHAVDFTNSSGSTRQGRVVHITFAEVYNPFSRSGNGYGRNFMAGFIHVLKPEALLDNIIGSDSVWEFKPEYNFIAGWAGEQDYDTAYKDDAKFDQLCFIHWTSAIDSTTRIVSTSTDSNGNPYYEPPPLINAHDDKTDVASIFFTGAIDQNTSSNNVSNTSGFGYIPVHNDGSVGPLIYSFDQTNYRNPSPASAFPISREGSDIRSTRVTYPFTSDDGNINQSGFTLGGAYLTSQPVPMVRVRTPNNVYSLYSPMFAEQSEFDQMVDDSQGGWSWTGGSIPWLDASDANAGRNGDYDYYLWDRKTPRNTVNNSTSLTNVDQWSQDIIGRIKVVSPVRDVGIDTSLDLDNDGTNETYYFDQGVSGGSAISTNTQSFVGNDSSKHVTGKQGATLYDDVGFLPSDRYASTLTANAAYLVQTRSQAISYPLDQITIRSDAPNVQTETTVEASVNFPIVTAAIAVRPQVSRSVAVAFSEVDITLAVAEAQSATNLEVDASIVTIDIAGTAQSDQNFGLDYYPVSATAPVVSIALTTPVDFPSVDVSPVIASQEDITETQADIAASITPPQVRVDLTTTVDFPATSITQPSTVESPTEFPIAIAVTASAPVVSTTSTVNLELSLSIVTVDIDVEPACSSQVDASTVSVDISSPAASKQVRFRPEGTTVTSVGPTALVETAVSVEVSSPSVSVEHGVYKAGISVDPDAHFPLRIDITQPEPRPQISVTATPVAITVSSTAPVAFTLINSIAEVDFNAISIDPAEATVTQADQSFSVAMPTVTTVIDGAGIVFRYDPDLPRIVSVDTESRIMFVEAETRISAIDEEIRIMYIMGDL